MPLIDLKTNLKSLGYGNDRPDGGSSSQPYIKTTIPGGDDFTQDLTNQARANDTSLPDTADFLLRNGYLAAISALKDGERLGRYFIDLKTPSGLLFTIKQQALERQNPDVDDGIKRIYNPLGTVLQAGVLPIGYHLNKQGFNVFRLGYKDSGEDGYYPFTNFQKTPDSANFPKLNRLASAYLAKITSNETLSSDANIFDIDLENEDVLLAYPGGPNSFLGIGKTKIRIKNPTRLVTDISPDQKFQPSFYSTNLYNPKYLTPIGRDPYVNYVYNPFSPIEDNIASNYIKLVDKNIFFSSFYRSILTSTEQDVNETLNRNETTISALQGFIYGGNIPHPGSRYFTYSDNLVPEAELPYFNLIQATSAGTSSLSGSVATLWENNVKSPISFPYPYYPKVLISYKDPNAIKGNPEYLVPKKIFSSTAVIYNTLTSLSSSLSSSTSASSFNPEINKEENVGVNGRFQYSDDVNSPKNYLIPFGNNIPAVYNFNASAEYLFRHQGIQKEGDDFDTIRYEFNGLQLGENIIRSEKESDISNIDANNDIYTFSYEQTITQSSAQKDQSTALIGVKDFRKTINEQEGEVLPSTDYSTFNREFTYDTSYTTYKGNYTEKREINPNIAIYEDYVTQKGDDMIDFYFYLSPPEISGSNANVQNELRTIYFRAYIEDWSDGVKAEWSSVKYMGRAESLYKYNGFSRDASVTFLVPALSRGDMINNYKRLNQLMWSTAPSYSTDSVAGLMRGVITYVTIGNYFDGMPSIIKNVNITPIGDMGWDINRNIDGTPIDESDTTYVGQLPRGLKVQVDFTPLHNFVPQYGEPFIGQNSRYIIQHTQ